MVTKTSFCQDWSGLLYHLPSGKGDLPLAALENLFGMATDCSLVVGLVEWQSGRNRVGETAGCGTLGNKIEKSG